MEQQHYHTYYIRKEYFNTGKITNIETYTITTNFENNFKSYVIINKMGKLTVKMKRSPDERHK